MIQITDKAIVRTTYQRQMGKDLPKTYRRHTKDILKTYYRYTKHVLTKDTHKW